MDPVSSLVSGHIAGKLLDFIGSRFRTHVIERWTKTRAEKFFEEFCRAVELELAGEKPEELDKLLNQILEDETRSEVLFDAYRRVSFARSKDLGPRIIGILSAQLVLEERLADEIEDNILMAAENMVDSELLKFAEFVREYKAKATDSAEKDAVFDDYGNLNIQWNKKQFDSNWRQVDNVSLAPLDLAECLGRWAIKLKSYGIISDDVKERQWEYQEDSERHIDEPGTVREVSWWIYLPKPYLRFAELIERVSETTSRRSATKTAT